VITDLFDHWMAHPEALPPKYRESALHLPRHRVVCDYIAGMTDTFILRQHRRLCTTKATAGPA
jgi:dGTPase